MALEVGKNRLEALGDVEETADLLRYYSDEFEKADGFVKPLGSLSSAEKTRSVLRPYGVFGVISPFNFPMALAGGPAGGAMIAGNTVVLKPSSDAPLHGLEVRRGAARRRPARRGLQPRHRPGRDGRRRAGGQPRHRRPRLHRQLRGRDAAVSVLHEGLSAPDHHRDGRQEPGDRDRQRGPRRGGRGRDALGVRLRRPEVQRQLAGLRGAAGRPRVRRAAGREGARHSASATRPSAELDGPGHQRAGAGQVHRRRSTRRAPTAARSRSAARPTTAAATSRPRPS